MYDTYTRLPLFTNQQWHWGHTSLVYENVLLRQFYIYNDGCPGLASSEPLQPFYTVLG